MERALQRVVQEHGLVRVRVDIDESRRDDLTGRLDGPESRLGRGVAHPNDVPAVDQDVGDAPRCAGAVNDGAASDEEVVHLIANAARTSRWSAGPVKTSKAVIASAFAARRMVACARAVALAVAKACE